MSHLRLDDASQKVQGRSWVLLLVSLAGFGIVPAVTRSLETPAWLSLVAVFVPVAGVVISTILLRRVRCPHCSKALLIRLGPTWYKPPRASRERGVLQCRHCHQLVNILGGTSPPSSSSSARQ